MPTIVGILTFISMINTSSDSLKAWKVFIFNIIVFIRSLNFVLSWVEHAKSCITSGPGSSLFAWRKLVSLVTHWMQWRFWSDRADAHADLSLGSEHWFCWVLLCHGSNFCLLPKFDCVMPFDTPKRWCFVSLLDLFSLGNVITWV